MRNLVFASLLIGVAAFHATVCRAGDAVPFQFVKEIQSGPRTREEMLVVPLDSDVYSATKDNLADLKVIDAEGRAVPFLLKKATETKPQTIRSTWIARDIALKPLADDDLEIRVRLDEKDVQPSGLRLVTPLRNFEQRVRVFGVPAAKDNAEEKPLVTDAVVFDYSQYMDVSQYEVRLPESTFREFRIVIDGLTSDQESQLLNLTRTLRGGNEDARTENTMIQRRPFRIDRIELWSEEVQQSVKKELIATYPVAKFDIREDEKEQQTVIEVHTRREPLNELRVRTSSRNFSRRAVVMIPETRGVKTDWRDIGQATISSFQFRELSQDHRAIAFSETRHETYRIVIDNRDSPPLEITSIEASGPVDEVAFLAAPTATYRLTYSADVQEKPQYDTAALNAALLKGIEPLRAKLGPQSPSAEFGKEAPLGLQALLNNKIILGAIVCLLVAALAWGLYRAGQRIEQIPKDETSA